MLRGLVKFLGFCLIFVIVLVALYSISEKWRFNAIVIHHSASAVDNYRSIAEFHRREKGWRDAAYHLILSNGSTAIPLGYLEATGRYRYLSASVATRNIYYNLRAIHICVVGDFDRHEMPEALQAALVDVLRQLQEKYGIAADQILFHRDCSASSCPGRLITKEKLHRWLSTEASQCPLSLRIQHEKVIIGGDRLIYSVERQLDRLGVRVLRVVKSILGSGGQMA